MNKIWIETQEGNLILTGHINKEVIDPSCKVYYISCYYEDTLMILGRYTSEEKMDKVITMIKKHIEFGTGANKVFTMPQDKEV